jgi:predicted metal-dependent hydrolase
MDKITEQYSQAAQKQLQQLELVSQAFRQQCEKLKIETEQRIATIDRTKTQAQDLENRYKLKLKQDLQQVLNEYEKELQRNFGIGLIELENIYRQKEMQRLQEIEQEILAM